MCLHGSPLEICGRRAGSGSKFVFQHFSLPLLVTSPPVLHTDLSTAAGALGLFNVTVRKDSISPSSYNLEQARTQNFVGMFISNIFS